MCYSAQKEREKISQRTKEGLTSVKMNGSKGGKPIGVKVNIKMYKKRNIKMHNFVHSYITINNRHPRSNKSSITNFIRTLEYMVSNNVGQKLATKHTSYPIITFRNDLKKYYNLYNVNCYRELLIKLRECC